MLPEGYLTNWKFAQPVRKKFYSFRGQGGEPLKSRGKRREAGFSADNSSAQTNSEMPLASVFSSVRVVSNKEYFKCLTVLKIYYFNSYLNIIK